MVYIIDMNVYIHTSGGIGKNDDAPVNENTSKMLHLSNRTLTRRVIASVRLHVAAQDLWSQTAGVTHTLDCYTNIYKVHSLLS